MEDLNDKVANGGTTGAGKLAHTDWNQVTSELQNTIEKLGITLSGADLTQLLVAVTKASSGLATWCTDTGSGSAYVLTPAYTVGNVLFNGLTLKFRPANDSTVINPTVNYNGTSPKTIKNEAGDALNIGDLNVLRDCEIRYDSSAGGFFRLLTRSTNLLLASNFKKGHILGLQLLNGQNDADYGVIVNSGEAANSNGTLNLVLATIHEKKLNSNWVAGTDVGGKPSALTIQANSWYRVFIIGGNSATTDIGFDTNANASALLSTATLASGTTFDKYRQIGWIMTNDAATTVRKFYPDLADPNEMYWQQPVRNVNEVRGGGSPVTTRQTFVATAPPDSQSILSAFLANNPGGSTNNYMDIRPVVMTDIAADATNFVLRGDDIAGGSFAASCIVRVLTNSSSEVAFRIGGGDLGNVSYAITTRGFRYMRGSLT